jgi:hypothetical protein
VQLTPEVVGELAEQLDHHEAIYVFDTAALMALVGRVATEHVSVPLLTRVCGVPLMVGDHNPSGDLGGLSALLATVMAQIEGDDHGPGTRRGGDHD